MVTLPRIARLHRALKLLFINPDLFITLTPAYSVICAESCEFTASLRVINETESGNWHIEAAFFRIIRLKYRAIEEVFHWVWSVKYKWISYSMTIELRKIHRRGKAVDQLKGFCTLPLTPSLLCPALCSAFAHGLGIIKLVRREDVASRREIICGPSFRSS